MKALSEANDVMVGRIIERLEEEKEIWDVIFGKEEAITPVSREFAIFRALDFYVTYLDSKVDEAYTMLQHVLAEKAHDRLFEIKKKYHDVPYPEDDN